MGNLEDMDINSTAPRSSLPLPGLREPSEYKRNQCCVYNWWFNFARTYCKVNTYPHLSLAAQRELEGRQNAFLHDGHSSSIVQPFFCASVT
jgi:hypothetical protein